ncbi:MAG: hypothetical protein E7264_07255 [Lachnospiraceae bacterium]|nr:hypothetical protein [Lachnospiraceae bacterium]
MKKLLITITSIMCAMSLAACGKETSQNMPETSISTENKEVAETKTGDGIDDITGDPSTIVDVNVEETVLLDEGDYKLTLSESMRKETGENDGILFKIDAQNNTSQKVAVCFKKIKVNGEPILLTEAAALSERYGVEVDANGVGYPAVMIPLESLYASGITTIEKVSFVVEIYPVTGSYGEFGDVLYTSDELTFETLVGYGESADDNEEELTDEEDVSLYVRDKVSVDKQVLLDDETLKICTTGEVFCEDGYAQRIGITVENKTDNKCMIKSKYIAVNGYEQTTYLMDEIAAGETLETSIDIFLSDLEVCNIDKISTIAFVLDVGLIDFVTYPEITIQISDTESEQSSSKEGTTVLNENGIEIIALDCRYNQDGAAGPVFVINNHSGSFIMTSFENVTINGIEVGMQSHMIADGLSEVSLFDYSDDMEDNGIESITEFRCTLIICDDEFKKIVDNAKIEVSY